MSIFLKRYEEIFGKEFKKILDVKLRSAIRINTIKITEKELVKRLREEKAAVEKIPFADFGYFVDAKFSIGATPEYLQGYYYVQEAASQLPVQVLNPDKKDVILDMAAAPGGKTTQIAQYMENKGVLVALDKEDFRLKSLKNNLERCGVANCLVYKKDGQDVSDLNIEFDKVLLDAPCSGNLVVDKIWLDKKSIEGIRERAELQKKLLKAAVSVLKENGVLVYSTCSMEPEENEMVIDWALSNLPIKLEKAELQIGIPALTEFEGRRFSSEIKKCIRIVPYQNNTQPFFIAKITKK